MHVQNNGYINFIFFYVYSFIYSLNFTVFWYFVHIQYREKNEREESARCTATYVSCISREVNRTIIAQAFVYSFIRSFVCSFARSFNYKWFWNRVMLSLFCSHSHYTPFILFVLQQIYIDVFSHIYILHVCAAYNGIH